MILSLAGPLAVTPMEAARYTISGVPNFPERKNYLKEFGYGMLDKAGDAIIQDEDIGAKAQAQMVKDYFALKKLDKELEDNFDPLKPLSLNMGGYAEEKPFVSLAGQYADTTPMPAPNYSNIDAPQIQRGSGGDMAKDMAMKVGMKMAMTAMGIPPVFNEGGYVPQYANEGMMPVGYKEDFPGIAGFSLLRPFVKGMDKLFGYDRYPNESGNMPITPEIEVIPLPTPENEMKGPPLDMPYYDPPRDFYDNPPRAPLTDPSELEQNQKRIEDIDRQIEAIEKRIEELKKQEQIDNENKFKGLIEEGYIPGAGYASLPMDKENITRLMS